jgi:hypothetical protein
MKNQAKAQMMAELGQQELQWYGSSSSSSYNTAFRVSLLSIISPAFFSATCVKHRVLCVHM